MDLNLKALIGLAVINAIQIAIIVWIGYDTHRYLKRKYGQATDEDVDKFMRDNAPLMDDLAGRKRNE